MAFPTHARFVIIGAGWPGPVRRVAEALAAWHASAKSHPADLEAWKNSFSPSLRQSRHTESVYLAKT